jgi:hypothetical protein
MLSRPLLSLALVVSSLLPLSAHSGGIDSTASLTLSTAIRGRTSLEVSSSHLRFEVSQALPEPTVVVAFRAAARARPDTDVVLTVETQESVRTPSGVMSRPVVWFRGEGGRAGALSEAGPHLVATWKGSGVRQGQVVFTLRGAAVAGDYALPVSFILSTP